MVASQLRLIGALAAPLLVALGFLACSDDPGDDGGGGGPNGYGDPEPMFRGLQDDLIATCGGANGTCHVRGSYQQAPTWLGGPDPYVTIKKYRGILPPTREVGDSILLTQVKHAGPALKDAPKDLYRRVADWLLAEVPPPPLPNSGKFPVPSGFNSIDLSTAGEGLTGARVTFLATDQNNVLTLDALKITAPPNANLKIESPFFVILPRNGKVNADPDVNGFKGELTVPAGATVDMFTGKMILLRWDPAGELKIVFTKIESSPGQAVLTQCSALDKFTSSAVPAMRMQVDQLAGDDCLIDAGTPDASPCPPPDTVIGKNTCIGCHGGGDKTAQNGLDLSDVDTDPGKACAQARNWINFGNKDQSIILLNPQGKANPFHPMKAIGATDPIVVGIKAWVDAESEK